MFLETKNEPKPVTLEPWRRLCLEGADLIEKTGLAKHIIKDQCGRYCWLGALFFVQNDGRDNYGNVHDPVIREAATKTLTYLGIKKDIYPASQMVHWNNARERTSEEVIAAMRGAAKQAI
jgi:hypothetical protein